MNEDSEAAAKLSTAVYEIGALLHPPSAQPGTTPPAPHFIPPPSRATVNRFYSVVMIVAIINFVAFLIGTGILGGAAANGKAESGRYYVGEHGKLTEVSKAAFTYSRIHGYTLFITHGMAFICAALFGVSKRSK